MIAVEEHLSHYGIKTKHRADIIIHSYNKADDTLEPIVVIECKAPGVLLGEKAGKQMLDYADELLCDYAMITDGIRGDCFRYEEHTNGYIEITELPQYMKMLKNEYTPMEIRKIPDRIRFEKLPEEAEIYIGTDIGENTSFEKVVPMVNLWECLLSADHKLPVRQYKIFSLIEDYGVRSLSYGNAAGGTFSGPYRSFLIENEGKTEFVSIGISTYWTSAKSDIVRTSLNVAIDSETGSHHSLQLVIDDNMIVTDNKCFFFHHGRIGVGNIGSGKIGELREIVNERYPSIISENKFFMGSLTYDRLWYLDDEEVINFIENLISYAIVRDEYRELLKRKRLAAK